MVTFNFATISTDENGKTFLDLEIQAVFNDKTVIIDNVFPATENYVHGQLQQHMFHRDR